MKKLSFAVVGAAALALAACGGKGDDSLGENVQEP
jgi:predicted small lipoprotein YifL